MVHLLLVAVQGPEAGEDTQAGQLVMSKQTQRAVYKQVRAGRKILLSVTVWLNAGESHLLLSQTALSFPVLDLT